MNKIGSRNQSATSASIGSNHTEKPSEEDAKNKIIININLPICTLHGVGHSMNLCKVVQAQANYMKGTFS